jgi:Luciferase-like monooxygenase
MAATLDRVSDGRLELGIGAGWNEEESGAYGIELGGPAERSDRFEEACEVMVSLLTRPTTDFTGKYYQLTSARCEPKPVQQPHPQVIQQRRPLAVQLCACREPRVLPGSIHMLDFVPTAFQRPGTASPVLCSVTATSLSSHARGGQQNDPARRTRVLAPGPCAVTGDTARRVQAAKLPSKPTAAERRMGTAYRRDARVGGRAQIT